MRTLLVTLVVAMSVAWLPCLNQVAAQTVTGDTRLLAAATYVAFGFGGAGGFVSDVDAVREIPMGGRSRLQ